MLPHASPCFLMLPHASPCFLRIPHLVAPSGAGIPNAHAHAHTYVGMVHAGGNICAYAMPMLMAMPMLAKCLWCLWPRLGLCLAYAYRFTVLASGGICGYAYAGACAHAYA